MMVPRKSGLIVNVSSAGGLRYLFNVPYGIGKAANDRMAQDCGIELRKHNVACIALWPGPVQTEKIQEKVLGKYSHLKTACMFSESFYYLSYSLGDGNVLPCLTFLFTWI